MSKVAVTSRNYNEKAYLASNPDVAEAVKKGDFKSGKAHYNKFGWKESRTMNIENNDSEKTVSDSNKNTRNNAAVTKVVGFLRHLSLKIGQKTTQIAAPTNALDYYVLKEPSNQNLIDLFNGEWSSQLPISSGLVTEPGSADLFEDQRVIWAKEVWGGFTDFKILELGPLEGGHTYMFQNFGAKKIVAIEANTRAFLKCLCIKEIFKLDRVEFKLGDFISFLRKDDSKYDMVFASGVLYHMEEPIELLKLISKVTDRTFIWTQYYDENIISKRKVLAHKFSRVTSFEYDGISYDYSRQSYKEALNWAGFCGGPKLESKWLTRDSILKAIQHYGFVDIQINFDHPNHPNGPALAICAKK